MEQLGDNPLPRKLSPGDQKAIGLLARRRLRLTAYHGLLKALRGANASLLTCFPITPTSAQAESKRSTDAPHNPSSSSFPRRRIRFTLRQRNHFDSDSFHFDNRAGCQLDRHRDWRVLVRTRGPRREEDAWRSCCWYWDCGTGCECIELALGCVRTFRVANCCSSNCYKERGPCQL
jgi:hypothetical protein